jgi:hypothetical protein
VKALLRLAGCASFVGLCFAGAYALFPDAPARGGLDLAECFRCQRAFDSETARCEELERLQRLSRDRMRAKDQIALELIADRLSLTEAARRFEELPDAPAWLWFQLRADYAGVGKEECMCRHVIDWARELLRDHPGRAEALRQRLEEELREHLRPSSPHGVARGKD